MSRSVSVALRNHHSMTGLAQITSDETCGHSYTAKAAFCMLMLPCILLKCDWRVNGVGSACFQSNNLPKCCEPARTEPALSAGFQ